VFFCAYACAYPNYGGSGGAAERLAGFVWAGIANPVWATTSQEIRNSGGSIHNQTGVRTMFKFRFAAICRTDKKSHIHHLSTIASSEREARRQLSCKFVLFFQARLPVSGGAA